MTAVLSMSDVTDNAKNQFTEQEVDYNTFKEAADGASSIAAPALALAVGALFLQF